MREEDREKVCWTIPSWTWSWVSVKKTTRSVLFSIVVSQFLILASKCRSRCHRLGYAKKFQGSGLITLLNALIQSKEPLIHVIKGLDIWLRWSIRSQSTDQTGNVECAGPVWSRGSSSDCLGPRVCPPRVLLFLRCSRPPGSDWRSFGRRPRRVRRRPRPCRGGGPRLRRRSPGYSKGLLRHCRGGRGTRAQ